MGFYGGHWEAWSMGIVENDQEMIIRIDFGITTLACGTWEIVFFVHWWMLLLLDCVEKAFKEIFGRTFLEISESFVLDPYGWIIGTQE
jgi:hypothetical protein